MLRRQSKIHSLTFSPAAGAPAVTVYFPRLDLARAARRAIRLKFGLRYADIAMAANIVRLTKGGVCTLLNSEAGLALHDFGLTDAQSTE